MSRRVLVLGLICFLLLMAALATRTGGLALMALPFLTYLGAGILARPSARRVRLIAERSLVMKRSEDGARAELRVMVRNSGPDLSAVVVQDLLQPGMTVIDGDMRHYDALPRGEETHLAYTLRAERGAFRWETVRVTVSDPFGLFPKALDVPAPAEVVFRPRVKTIRPIPLRPVGTLHSPGLIPARRGGSGTDFWGIREYRPGDPLRRLDWRRNARHPHRLFTAEIEQEEIADVGIILDARQKEDLRVMNDSLFERSLDAVISLADALLRRGNRVGLLVAGDGVTAVHPGYGKVQLQRILRTLAGQRPAERGSFFAMEKVLLRLFEPRALIILLSPFMSGEWEIFQRLRARGNQGLLISPDPVDFMKAAAAYDDAGRLARRLARVQRRLQLRRVAQLGVRVIDWQVSRPLSPLLRGALRATRGSRG